jgi:hypothetical protein
MVADTIAGQGGVAMAFTAIESGLSPGAVTTINVDPTPALVIVPCQPAPATVTTAGSRVVQVKLLVVSRSVPLLSRITTQASAVTVPASIVICWNGMSLNRFMAVVSIIISRWCGTGGRTTVSHDMSTTTLSANGDSLSATIQARLTVLRSGVPGQEPSAETV